MTSVGIGSQYPNSLLIDKWNETDLAQWGSGAAPWNSQNISTGGVTLAVAAGLGQQGKIGISVSMTTSAAGYWAFKFTPRAALPNRYVVAARFANGVQSSGSNAIGTMWCSNNATGASHYCMGSTLPVSATGVAIRRVEAGALFASGGTVGGATQAYGLVTPGTLSLCEVFLTTPVVTNPSFSCRGTAYGAATTVGSQGSTFRTAGFASYTGWNGLALDTVGIFGTWTAAATETVTVDLLEFYILKHPRDW